MLSLSASRRRSVALIVALALGASACGSDEASTSPTLASTTTAPAAEGDTAPPPSDQTDASDETDAQASPPASDDPAAEEPSENLFPDIDVVNIVDGSTVNLADELGGGDRPTLLWFWAPH